MEITPTSTFYTPAQDKVSSRSEALDQADFLKMLTAQLQSQDPLNPLESHEYASQLATFSQLQELEDMNKTLSSSLDANLLLTQSINNNMAAALVGKYVRAELNSFNLGSAGDANLRYTLPENATNVKVEILDASGKIVDTIEQSAQEAGDVTAVWDGRTSDGTRAAEGAYTFEVTAYNATGDEIDVASFIEGRISQVSYEDGGVVLTVDGTRVRLGQVISIFSEEPDGDTNPDNLANHGG